MEGVNDKEQDLMEEQTHEPLMDTDVRCHKLSSEDLQREEPEKGMEEPKEEYEQIKVELHQGEVKIKNESTIMP